MKRFTFTKPLVMTPPGGITVYPTDPADPHLVADRRFRWLDQIDVKKVMASLSYQLDNPDGDIGAKYITASWPEQDAVIRANKFPKNSRFTVRGVKVIGGNRGPYRSNPIVETNRPATIQWFLETVFRAQTVLLHCRWRYRCWKNGWPREPVTIPVVSTEDQPEE